MSKNTQLIKYEDNHIKRFFSNIWSKIKNQFFAPKLWDKEIEDIIKTEFPDLEEQDKVKELLTDLLSRNQYLFETLDIRMLHNDILKMFEKPILERIIADKNVQRDILELSEEGLKTYEFLLNLYGDKETTNRIWEEIQFCKTIQQLRPQQWELEYQQKKKKLSEEKVTI